MNNSSIPYSIKRSPRARSIRITVYHTGEVKVTVSRLIPQSLIERFVAKKSSWIIKKREEFLKHPISQFSLMLRKQSRKEYLTNKKEALKILTERLNHFNKHYTFEVGKITIRNQKSRWGSCSRKQNINFNYKLLFLPAEIRDYVVVHELCHIKELNHSSKFWDLVRETIPDFKDIRKRLKGIG